MLCTMRGGGEDTVTCRLVGLATAEVFPTFSGGVRVPLVPFVLQPWAPIYAAGTTPRACGTLIEGASSRLAGTGATCWESTAAGIPVGAVFLVCLIDAIRPGLLTWSGRARRACDPTL